MGESDRYIDNKNYYRPNRFLLGQSNNALMALFTINIIFFLILLVAQVVYLFYNQPSAAFNDEVIQWFLMPASISKLSERPWTILTQMFCHASVLELLSNMLWLWAFGYILQQISGNKKLIPIYIYGGLAGALFFIVSYYSIPSAKSNLPNGYLHTAGASTIAIAVTTTVLAPNFRFFRNLNGGIPIWVLLLIYLAIDITRLMNINVAYGLAHIGGAAAGYLFVFFLRKGKDASVWMNNLYSWVINLFNPAVKKQPRPTSVKEKIFYEAGNKIPYNKTPIVTQQRIDEILDKINSHGFHFLTDEEKNILKKASEE